MNISHLGLRIKSQREKNRLTQQQLAHSLTISAQAISKWERGENAPDISMLKPLSLLLGVSIDWLLTGGEAQSDTFKATILCTSLRDFAVRSAAFSCKDIALYMNALFQGITDIVLLYEGVPIKYVGDGFLAYFSGDAHAKRAHEATQKAMKILKEPTLLMTLNTGDIYLGTIGHSDYSRPDIIGDAVNVSFLLNAWATKHATASVVISDTTMRQLSVSGYIKQENISLSETHQLTCYKNV